MKNEVLKRCSLFDGMSDDEMSRLLNCLPTTKKRYEKDEFVFVAGDKIDSVGIVISGSVNILQEDFWGNRVILANLKSGELFGESFACAGVDSVPVSVIATDTTEILFLNYNRIVGVCSSTCTFHTRLIRNMLGVLAEKNIMFNRKIAHISKRSIREKLLSYLSENATRGGKNARGETVIPFDRQAFADYLCVDRSALSRELSKMQNEGLLKFEKNRFKLFTQ